jgi:hypothetical protein
MAKVRFDRQPAKNQKLEDRIADEKDDELVMLQKNDEDTRVTQHKTSP